MFEVEPSEFEMYQNIYATTVKEKFPFKTTFISHSFPSVKFQELKEIYKHMHDKGESDNISDTNLIKI